MQLTEVHDVATARRFLQVNIVLNQPYTGYIRPLDKDVESVFDPARNKAFRHGECTRWILEDVNGQLIGRIAAFVNRKYRNKGDDLPVGGIGFFDCIDNRQAAELLFDVARHWLLQRGMEAMDGPINFGERDRWWGLLVEGFTPPVYCLNYNPPYYKSLFEGYGFRNFYNQLCFGIDPQKKFQPKFYQRHAAIAADPAYHVEWIDKKRLNKYAADFTTVYNKAWAGHGGLKQLKHDQVLLMLQSMKPVMDERLILFVYHHQEPIALFVNLPDLNQWFKHLNGKFDWWHQLKFLFIKKSKPNTKIVGVVFGIVPEYQGKGIDAYMIVEQGATLLQTAYMEYEMQWIGDFNPKMINIVQHMGDVFRSRTLTTYRYLFDATRVFKPHPLI